MLTKGNLLLVGIALMGLLESCSAGYASEASLCIPPNVTDDYNLGLKRKDVYTVPRRKPMPSWWKPQLGMFQSRPPILDYPADIVTRQDNEIWIGGYANATPISLIMYNSRTHSISKYSVLDSQGKPYSAIDLLVTSDNSLWVLLVGRGSDLWHLALARFYPSQNMFKVVRDEEGLLNPERPLERYLPLPPQSLLAETPNSRLVVGMDGKIYEYDPATNRANQVPGTGSELIVTSFQVSGDGHIWFVTKNDFSVRELDPADGVVWNHGSPPGSDLEDPADQYAMMGQPLDIDDEGRVWAADFGWLEPPDSETGYVWHPLPRSTIFLSVYDPEYLYRWERPNSVHHLSDGDIWFVGLLTIARFEPASKTWCWAAPSSGPLAEDEDGNVWLVDRQIYRYGYELHR